jgi:hypothetical protein
MFESFLCYTSFSIYPLHRKLFYDRDMVSRGRIDSQLIEVAMCAPSNSSIVFLEVAGVRHIPVPRAKRSYLHGWCQI